MTLPYHILGPIRHFCARWLLGVLAWGLAFAAAIVVVACMTACTTVQATRDTRGKDGQTTHTHLGGTMIDSDAGAKLAGWIGEGAATVAPFLPGLPGLIATGIAGLAGGGYTAHRVHKYANRRADDDYHAGVLAGRGVQPGPAAGAGGAGAEVRG
jgi:hypothetical protein